MGCTAEGDIEPVLRQPPVEGGARVGRVQLHRVVRPDGRLLEDLHGVAAVGAAMAKDALRRTRSTRHTRPRSSSAAGSWRGRIDLAWPSACRSTGTGRSALRPTVTVPGEWAAHPGELTREMPEYSDLVVQRRLRRRDCEEHLLVGDVRERLRRLLRARESTRRKPKLRAPRRMRRTPPRRRAARAAKRASGS